MSKKTWFYLYGKIRHYYHSYIVHNEFNPTLIIDNIYVGNVYDAHNIEELKKHNITNVISAVTGFDNIYDSSINHLSLNLIDDTQQNIIHYFDIALYFIQNAVTKKQPILIHCICGISRSVTLIIVYLINKYNYNVINALQFIQKKRPIANPNSFFIHQLLLYYNQLLGTKP